MRRIPFSYALLAIPYTAKSQGSGSVVARCHQQELSMLVVAIGLRKIPYRALRLIVAATAKYPSAGVVVDVFVGPLPDVSDHVGNSERTGARRVRINTVRRAERPAL